MANQYGYLPKVDLLSDEQQRRLDTWSEKAYADDNLFRTLANNDVVLDMFLDWVGVMYGRQSELDRHMVELCRIRMANQNECFH
jgi:hypothetical protein